jgi:hypothetical protein
MLRTEQRAELSHAELLRAEKEAIFLVIHTLAFRRTAKDELVPPVYQVGH